ncbi:MAG: 3-deoxy-7-phosphoheptulonate synthase [Bacteroidia bacterium]|nr:3-deoxy-7-phosphoheptulonate synthase [Bacteroidia bacterium]
MWLLLRPEAKPDALLAYLSEKAIPAHALQLGERWAIEIIPNGYLPEAFLRWEEVEKVIGPPRGAPLVTQWKGELSLGAWQRGKGPLWIAGPCSVEEKSSLLSLATDLQAVGVHILRGGAFKARTSPYAFQGWGEKALDWLVEARALTGLPLCVEVISEKHLSLYAERNVDLLQIGARNMDNYWLLKETGNLGKPILLKRNPQATLEEWLLAAEYLLLSGAPGVLLCERGIRTFDRTLRYTFDIGILPVLAHDTSLPRIADPSHAAGHWRYVEPLALAALAAGAEGLIVEVHPDPLSARSDATQQLTLSQFTALLEKANSLYTTLHPISPA